jgi:hypothetical protein
MSSAPRERVGQTAGVSTPGGLSGSAFLSICGARSSMLSRAWADCQPRSARMFCGWITYSIVPTAPLRRYNPARHPDSMEGAPDSRCFDMPHL